MERIKNKTHDILRWSEKYTKTDMVYLASGGFWLFLKQGITLVIGFVVSIAFANMLDPEVYGNYKYIITFAGIVGAFSLTGLGTSLTRSVAKGYEGSLKLAFRRSLKWSLLSSFILFVSSLYYFTKNNNLLSFSLFAIAIIQPLINAGAIYSSFLNGKKKFYISSMYGIYYSVIISLSILITLLITKDVFLIVIVNFIVTALMSVILYLKTKKFVENSNKDSEMVPYAWHLSIINAVNATAERLDGILLFTFLGGAQLAIFSFAILIPEQIVSAFRNISILAYPKLSTQNKDEMKKNVYSKSLSMSLYAIPVIIIYILLAPAFFKLFFPIYASSVIFSQVYVISILSVTYMLPITGLTSLGSKKELHKITTLSSFIQIAALFPLVFYYGIWGAVIARIFYKFIKIILALFYFKKYENGVQKTQEI